MKKEKMKTDICVKELKMCFTLIPMLNTFQLHPLLWNPTLNLQN